MITDDPYHSQEGERRCICICMEGEAKLQETFRSFNTISSSLSPPNFFRNVQAAFKRHRPLGIQPRRLLVPQQEASKSSSLNVDPIVNTKKIQEDYPPSQKAKDAIAQTKNMVCVAETQEDTTITAMSGSMISTNDEHYGPFDVQRIQPRFTTGCRNNDTVSSSIVELEHVPLNDGQKKVHFALGNNDRSQEMDWDVGNQVESSIVMGQEVKHQNLQNVEMDVSLKSDYWTPSLLAKRYTGVQDQLHQFRDFIQSDRSYPMAQSSVVGSSATTTFMLSSTTYCSNPHQNSCSNVVVESFGSCDVNYQPMAQRDIHHLSHLPSNYTGGILNEQTAIETEARSSAVDTQSEVNEYDISKDQGNNVPKECDIPKDGPPLDNESAKGKAIAGDVTDVQSHASMSKNPSSDEKFENSKSEKQEKVATSRVTSAPRKRNYDPNLFFKVNGKLYQRLGKIGSGGSSEVHKVISSECKIYALKRIKLKGRDYATAYGFCQEIQYLHKLKGKKHIIQLIDYEVTEKALFKEVMNGSMSNMDGRFKEDGYIYMVLEYGEIDLAHMLSQKWKELDSSMSTIDENWLRFYWQQILLAVNTIHEERIVHSDLKPANFLLVRGSLKLIDFGIAKAIMNDTTNIQRESQAGTLSYMSPEAFMCNETDASGNKIKCGRSSDIWSLGCILYQMVYGRTPFSEYKTFWAKFKVITDPNHEITFEPVSNPWLLDLMKNCLAWDQHKRWRIPELFMHPFLVPPAPSPQLTIPQEKSCKLLQLIAESCENDPKALKLCCEIQQLLRDPQPEITSQVPMSLDQQCMLLSKMSSLCFQLQEQLANSK